MNARVGRVRDASDEHFGSFGAAPPSGAAMAGVARARAREARYQARQSTVTLGRVNLLNTMIEERESVFTPDEARHAGLLKSLLEAHCQEINAKGTGMVFPYERWDKAFNWLKGIKVRERQASQVSASGPCVDHGNPGHAKCQAHGCCVGHNTSECRARSSVPLIVEALGREGAMGVYETPDGDFYVVAPARKNHDHTVARRIVEFSGDRLMLSGEHRDVRSLADRGAVYRLRPEWKITPERALQFIEIVGRCPRCVGMGLSGRLRDGVSVEMGSGKVCSEAMGLGERYHAAAAAARAAKRAARVSA